MEYFNEELVIVLTDVIGTGVLDKNGREIEKLEVKTIVNHP